MGGYVLVLTVVADFSTDKVGIGGKIYSSCTTFFHG